MREMQGRAAGEARNARVRRWLAAWSPTLLWMLAPGVLLALIGPFGSFAAPFGTRLLYWVPTMAAGAVLGVLAARVLVRVWPSLEKRRLVFTFIHAVLVTALMVFVVWAWGAVAFGGYGAIKLSWTLAFYVGVVTVAISAIRIVMAPRAGAPAPAPSVAQTSVAETGSMCASLAAPALARRLKPEFRAAPILALEAEDHYVRVHTAAGADLILIRLSDAIDEMGGVAGVRPHRSWWAAREAVVATERKKGRLVLTLNNGLQAPVSRAAAAAVRAAFKGKE